MKTQEKKAFRSFKTSQSSKFSSVHKGCRFHKWLIFFEQKYRKLLLRVWKLSEWKKFLKKSAWKCPYGHLKRIFDKPADFFFFRFRSFLAKNPRTIKRWGSFKREFHSSVRRFRRTRRKHFWQKWRNTSNKVCSFFSSSFFFWNVFSRKKCSLECPSGHLVCMFDNLPQFFLSRIAKTNFAQSHETFENRKFHSTQKKLLSKLPLNTSFVVLRTCRLSGLKVCHRSGKLWQFKKREISKKDKTVPPHT